VQIVAERIGDDPVPLRNYVKRKRQNTADNSVSAASVRWPGMKALRSKFGSVAKPFLILVALSD
jgi:DNA-directed RNA polymerase